VVAGGVLVAGGGEVALGVAVGGWAALVMASLGLGLSVGAGVADVVVEALVRDLRFC
jgi:hypothetical protein